jgi:hypothetical protein
MAISINITASTKIIDAPRSPRNIPLPFHTVNAPFQTVSELFTPDMDQWQTGDYEHVKRERLQPAFTGASIHTRAAIAVRAFAIFTFPYMRINSYGYTFAVSNTDFTVFAADAVFVVTVTDAEFTLRASAAAASPAVSVGSVASFAAPAAIAVPARLPVTFRVATLTEVVPIVRGSVAGLAAIAAGPVPAGPVTGLTAMTADTVPAGLAAYSAFIVVFIAIVAIDDCDSECSYIGGQNHVQAAVCARMCRHQFDFIAECV